MASFTNTDVRWFLRPTELLLNHNPFSLLDLKRPKLGKTQGQLTRPPRKTAFYVAGSLPSRASFNGVTNRWNSISSMADSTSLAFSVLRFPFIAKLLALGKKKKCVTAVRGPSYPTRSRWEKKHPAAEWESLHLRCMDFGVTRVSVPSLYKRAGNRIVCGFILLPNC